MAKKYNWAAIIIFGIMSLSIIDAALGLIESKALFRIVRGTTRPISGDLDSDPSALELLADLPEGADLSRELAVETNGPLAVHFIALRGRSWRGQLTVPEDMPAGEYSLAVFQRGYPPPPEAPRMQVRVFEDMDAYLLNVPSLIERHLGVKPWLLTLGSFPFGILLLYLAYREADREEERSRARGVGAIYKLAKGKNGWELVCGLGSKDGIQPGDTLTIIDDRYRCVGTFVPEKVEYDHSVALIPLDVPIRARHQIVVGKDMVPTNTVPTGTVPTDTVSMGKRP
ncbi:MAG: hypothetical protein AB7E47_01350 [Desulfovibrionaceae bacterium]